MLSNNNLLIQERIKAFEHIQISWLRSSGKLANYWKTVNQYEESGKEAKIFNSFLNITQIDLINEAIDVLQKGTKFSIIMADQILKDIQNEPQSKLTEKNKIRVEDVKRVAQNNYFQVSLWNANAFLARPIYYLANQLEARYIPFSQRFDPLIGKDFHGACYGHVLSWRDEIVATGKYLAMPRLDRNTFLYQKNQSTNFIMITGFQKSICRWKAIEKIIASLRDEYIYELSFCWKNLSGHSLSGHSTGLRKFKTGEVEFFDVNFGLFIFKNSQTFRVWFIYLLFEYHDYLFHIELNKIGVQPDNAIPTIPPIQLPKENIEEISFAKQADIYNAYKLIAHRAAISACKNDFRSQYLIYHEQQEIYFSIRNYLYNKIAIFKQKKYIEDKYAVTDTKDITHDVLKQRVLSLIQIEIHRLQNKTNDVMQTINLLNELKLKINNAHPSLTLYAVIDSWLSDRSKEEIITRCEVIYSQSKKAYAFVSKLMANYQINSMCVKVREAELLNVLIDIMRFKRKKNQCPQLFEDISGLIKIDPQISFFEMMIKIKNRCANNYSAKFFANTVKRDDEDVNKLCKIMNSLQTDHFGSVRRTIHSLNGLLRKMKLKVSNVKKNKLVYR